ncbi:glycosyltransferase [Spirulina major CS-329]|uniref:glycosyltransferase n=1 Tax=Spirulina TaxID=1154 RepID=UPI00232E4C69|nr:MULTISPECIES: glycosyltransferase [Spirulina]MDB9494381.1 glycosyltransferase [Spirulina subsalsa CS-330]MDB9502415.1 glycosyltransferase [Spirulina major CS-329]
MKVSVIIPIYNGAEDLPDLLAGLRSQTYDRTAVEYLLVDNHSQDQTSVIVQQAVQEFAAQGITLRSLQEFEIQSSYAARNAGILAAQGEILAFTDADCRPEPGWLANLVAPFADPGVGLVAGEVVALPGNSLLERYADRNETLSQRHTLNHPFRPYGQTANLGVRRDLLVEIGLFRPYLTTGGDADLCWRLLAQTQCRWEFAPTAVVKHRHRCTLAELRQQWRRYGRSNRYLHELHGVPLMRSLTPREALYRLSRWAVKELPPALLRGRWLDAVNTPLDLITFAARSAGQQQVRLRAEMANIPPWPERDADQQQERL